MSNDITNQIIVPEETKNNPHWDIVRDNNKTYKYIIAWKGRHSDDLYINYYSSAVKALAWITQEINCYGKIKLVIHKVVMSRECGLFPDWQYEMTHAKLHEDATIEINIGMNAMNTPDEVDKK
jgi:hypothetical protein